MKRQMLTLAGWSNHLPLVPLIYEEIWRPRSLTLLTRADFPAQRELSLIYDWLAPTPGQVIVDLGSSTAFYARGIARKAISSRREAPILVAVDMAMGMLRAGDAYARREGVGTRISPVRAPVEQLPFADGSIDALVCGGSLNEFRSMETALREARRVCAPEGRMVAMTLLTATSAAGRMGQWGARLSGIRFPRLDEFNALLESSGWECVKQQVTGVVVFTLMHPKSTVADGHRGV